MSYIDIAIIAIVTFFAIIGLAKGFFKSFISLFGWVVALAISIVLARYVAEALLDVKVVRDFVAGDGGFSLYNFVYQFLPKELDNLTADADIQDIMAAIGGGGILEVVISPLIKILNALSDVHADITLRQQLAVSISGNLFIFLVGIGLFLLARIGLMIITMAMKSAIDTEKSPNGFDRLMGFAMGAAKGAMYVVLSFIVISYVAALDTMNDFGKELDKSVIGKPVSKYVFELTEKYINGDDALFDRLFELTGRKTSYTMSQTERDIFDNVDLFVKTGFSQAEIEQFSDDSFVYGEQIALLRTFLADSKTNIATNMDRADSEAELEAIANSIKSGGELYTQFGNLKVNLNALKDAIDAFSGEDDPLDDDAINALAEAVYDNLEAIEHEINALAMNYYVNGEADLLDILSGAYDTFI